MRFVLTGTFHSLNRGDSAMQLAAAHALLKRWPEAAIAIHCPNAEADRELYQGLEVVPCSRRRPIAALRTIARAALWRATGGHAPPSPELQSYRNATAVIDLSGDGLTETFGWRCPLSHTIPLLLAHLMRTPFCLMAQTIGPFRHFRPWYRWVFSCAAFVTARDAETFHYLSLWNLPCRLEKTADIAFLLEPAPVAEAKNYLRSLGGFDPSRPTVGVTPSNLHNVKTASPQNYLQAVAFACKELARQTGAQPLIIPHVFGPGENYDDRRSAEALAGLMGPPLNPFVIREPLSPPQLKALIGCCDLFIGIRMHSVIAAISQAIPTLAIAYSPKLRALMKRIGTPRYVLDSAAVSGNDLALLARELWNNKALVRNSIGQKLANEIIPAARRNVDILSNFREP